MATGLGTWGNNMQQILWAACQKLAVPYACGTEKASPRMRGILILGRSRKFLAMWIEILSRKAGEM